MRKVFKLNVKGDKLVGVVSTPKYWNRKTVIMCYGINGFPGGGADLFLFEHADDALQAAGYRTVRFWFRGNRPSDLPFEESNLSTRVEDLRILLKEFGESFLFAKSFGACAAIVAAAEGSKIKRMACVNPAILPEKGFGGKFYRAVKEGRTYKRSYGEYTPQLWRDWKSYDLIELARKVSIPWVLFQAKDDEWNTIENAKKMTKGNNAFLKITSGGHDLEDRTARWVVRETIKFFSQEGGKDHDS